MVKPLFNFQDKYSIFSSVRIFWVAGHDIPSLYLDTELTSPSTTPAVHQSKSGEMPIFYLWEVKKTSVFFLALVLISFIQSYLWISFVKSVTLYNIYIQDGGR